MNRSKKALMLTLLAITSLPLLWHHHAAASGDGLPARHSTAAAARQYSCPMHPSVVKDYPGSCSICGMELVEKSGN